MVDCWQWHVSIHVPDGRSLGRAGWGCETRGVVSILDTTRSDGLPLRHQVVEIGLDGGRGTRAGESVGGGIRRGGVDLLAILDQSVVVGLVTIRWSCKYNDWALTS